MSSRPAAWAPRVDPKRTRQRWVAVRALSFVDTVVPSGETLDEIFEEELVSVDREAFHAQARRASPGERFVVLLYREAPRFVLVGTDVRLWTAPVTSGVLRRALNRSPDEPVG